MSLTLQLLGRPQACHRGRTFTLPAERRCQLLAHLALRRDWVTRAELAGLLWPELPRQRALTNLRKALHFAHALPWAEALESQSTSVRFVVDTDLQTIERALREARTAQAVEIGGGVLLDGMDDLSNQAWTEWLDGERAQQQRRWQELTRAHLAQLAGDPVAAAAFARQLLDTDPLDEDAVVALLTAQREQRDFDTQRNSYRAYALRLDEELGVEPSLRVAALLRAPGAPVSDDSIVGRERELDELHALLARAECRLLNVVGPGGVGKSSLVKHALKLLERRFTDGALWIALDDLSDPAQALARLADELRLTRAPQHDALQQVCERLGPRCALLVFDNAEHLAGIARLIERLLDAAPQLKVCTTSRARLDLPGEWLLPLQGLALPPQRPSADSLRASDAGRLFINAAALAKPDFDYRTQTAAVAELLHAVGGLPLAILLAAHWVRLLPVAEIVAELRRSLAVLDRGDEGEERAEHRSMQATFERSWQMLATREQQVLAALSVFVGTFSRDAANDVTGSSLPLLAALADKSLLQMPPGGRCSLHPLIRQFAAGKLDADAALVAARRHAEWFHRLLGRLAAAADEAQAGDEIEVELENCRAAWRWAVAQRASAWLAASSAALLRYFELRGRAEEGESLLREALAGGAESQLPPAHVAELLGALAHLQYRLYRLDEAVTSARQGIKAARSSANHGALLRCLVVMGSCHARWGHDHEARRILEQALRHARAANASRTVAVVLGHLANIDRTLGDLERAHARTLEVLAMQRELGDWAGVAARLNMLAQLHQQRGEWGEARARLDEALAISERYAVAFAKPHLLFNLANVCYLSGDLDASERAGRQSLEAARTTGNRGVETTALLHLSRVAVKRGDSAAARAVLHDAIVLAEATRSVPVQLDAVFCFAELVASEGDPPRAAELMRYFIARPEVDAADRTVAQASLDALGVRSAALSPLDLPLPELLGTLREETGADR